MPMNTAKAAENTSTTLVELINSSRVGQVIFANSLRTSLTKMLIFSHITPCALRLFAHLSENGRPGRTRTCNPRFWRPVLYHLSYRPNLPGFLMSRVLTAESAILFKFDPPRMGTAIFGIAIIPPATICTFQRYLFSWHFYLLMENSVKKVKTGADDQD